MGGVDVDGGREGEIFGPSCSESNCPIDIKWDYLDTSSGEIKPADGNDIQVKCSDASGNNVQNKCSDTSGRLFRKIKTHHAYLICAHSYRGR